MIMVQDLLAILPMMDDLILLDVSGDMIHKVRNINPKHRKLKFVGFLTWSQISIICITDLSTVCTKYIYIIPFQNVLASFELITIQEFLFS